MGIQKKTCTTRICCLVPLGSAQSRCRCSRMESAVAASRSSRDAPTPRPATSLARSPSSPPADRGSQRRKNMGSPRRFWSRARIVARASSAGLRLIGLGKGQTRGPRLPPRRAQPGRQALRGPRGPAGQREFDAGSDYRLRHLAAGAAQVIHLDAV